LWWVCDSGIGAGIVSIGDVSRVSHGWLLALVESEGVDVGAMAGIWLGAIVEDPNNLDKSVHGS
jgi:hypothetical protein